MKTIYHVPAGNFFIEVELMEKFNDHRGNALMKDFYSGNYKNYKILEKELKKMYVDEKTGLCIISVSSTFIHYLENPNDIMKEIL